mmetsp:Transcript_17410/g.66324  ORF Transcript_17410/g.66324 Transcript_17410/m.66324 type:complete len:81 (+) Transcript_17410:136-378(+)
MEVRARQQQLESERKALMELYSTCGPIRWSRIERSDSEDTDRSSRSSMSPPPPLRRSRRVRRLKISFQHEADAKASDLES